MTDRKPVGLVGVGLLGQALAQRLRGAGFEVVGFDVDPAKNAKLVGARRPQRRLPSPISRVRCDPIVLAVFTTDQVEEVVEQELLPALGESSGRIVLCASTCDPDRIAALGERLAARGLRFLETPVSGSSGQVARGEGVGLIGGDRRARRRGRAGPARAVSDLFPHRQARRRRARQARDQSHPRAQSRWRWPRDWFSPNGSGSMRRPFSRLRASRPLFAGDGRQGSEDDRAATSLPKAASPSTQGCPPHARAGRAREAAASPRRGPCRRAGGLRAPGEGDLDNCVVIEEIGRRTIERSDHD